MIVVPQFSFACSAYYIVHIIAGILLMVANASSRVDRCRNDPVGIIVIHTGTHHTGAVIHAWKRHGCNLIEIYVHVLLQKLEFALSEAKDSFCQSFPALCCHNFIHKVCHIHLVVPIF